MARVYLDSCLIIYLIQGPEQLNQIVRNALQPAGSSLQGFQI